MKHFVSVGFALALVVLTAGMARGQEMPTDPFDRLWDLTHSQEVHGSVVSITEQTYPLDWQTHKLMEKPVYAVRYEYEDGHLAKLTGVSPDGTEHPEAEIKYQNGLMVRQQLVRDGEPGPAGEITRDDHGDIQSVDFQRFKVVYEREYDAKGNWTKLTRLMVRQVNGKEVRDIEEAKTREIKYAP